MKLSEQFQPQAKPKLKLKYTCMALPVTDGYAFPAIQHATIDTTDLVSKAFYDRWFLNGRLSQFADTKACYIAIGIIRSVS